jgi:histidinol-phosphate aminotransferase
MMPSRRDFLRVGAGALTAAMPWRLAADGPPSFESPPGTPDQGFILLYSNENSYGPSVRVLDAIASAAQSSNRYPRVRYNPLAEKIAGVHHVSPDRVLLGCGSTEILRMAACAFLGKGKQLLHASPTFEAIGRYAASVDSEIIAVPLTSAFAHDLDAMLGRVHSSTRLVYICNPNNPTASLTPRKDLETFISKLPASTLVVLDEAYHHYAGASGMYASFLDHPFDDQKLIVVRTFSKVYGLAGLRLGYAIAAPKLIQQMRRFATQDDVNAIATESAAVALDDAEGVNDFIQQNANDRQEFFNQAMARALKPIDSHANFVMMNTFHAAEDVIQHFRKNNILIGRQFPPMDTYIRVSLGRPEEMRAFWQAWDVLPWAKNLMMHH